MSSLPGYYIGDPGHLPQTRRDFALGAFHSRLPSYKPTPLVPLPTVARRLGIREVWLKDESRRLELDSFKILGAAWATYRALQRRCADDLEPWNTVNELAERVSHLHPMRLQSATDGNHGRALAEVARWLGFDARIYVPAGTATARIRALRDAGAEVVEHNGSYDDAVARASLETDATSLVVSDTSWPGYEDIPRWIIEGYGTIFVEADEQVADFGAEPLDVVVVQMGVGSFAAAAAQHYSRGPSRARLLGVEPEDAACILASLTHGERTLVPGPHRSVMAGLNCGLPSLVAWPYLIGGLRASLAISDDETRAAVRELASVGIPAGESGAAGLAGLTRAAGIAPVRDALGLRRDSRVLLVNTEGVTDPESYNDSMSARDPLFVTPWHG